MHGFGQWDSHLQRFGTGSLLGVLLLFTLSLGPFWLWALLVGLVTAVGLWEFQGLIFPTALERRWQFIYLVLGLSLPLGAGAGGAAGLHFALFCALFCGCAAFLLLCPNDQQAVPSLARLILGWTYIPYLLSYLLLLGRLEKGRWWLIFVFMVIIAGDVGAYYGGKRWGRHKLYEQVSPKKTLEGAAAGLAASMVIGLMCLRLWFGNLSFTRAAGAVLIIALVGQVGDLIESMFKRLSGKKDSGALLPGHGGLLDRLDSLLFAFPATWFIQIWYAA